MSRSVCEDNTGTWYGPQADPSLGIPDGGFQYCCQVLDFLARNGTAPDDLPAITPLTSIGIRNDHYKIVENSLNAYVSPEQPCDEKTFIEFYEINEAQPLPLLDDADAMLPLDDLNPEQLENYNELSAQLAALQASVPPCPGDGNIDFVVDQLDLDGWRFYADSGGQSSVYDLNLDGLTNELDQAIIESHLGIDCRE